MELGRVLEKSLVQVFRRQSLKFVDSRFKNTQHLWKFQTNVRIDPSDTFPCLGNCRLDVLVDNSALFDHAALPASFGTKSIPVEFKVMSSDLFREHELQTELESEIYLPNKPQTTQQLNELVREVLVRNQIISSRGDLRISHSWVLQSMLYAMMMKKNKRKIGKLIILTKYGVYEHTFEVTLAQQNLIHEIISEINDKLSDSKGKTQPEAALEPKFIQSDMQEEIELATTQSAESGMIEESLDCQDLSEASSFFP